MKIMITGANGFIGQHLSMHLKNQGNVITKVTRVRPTNEDDCVAIGNIQPDTNWLPILENHQIVIHTAAIAHSGKNGKLSELDFYRQCNTESTLNLARQSAIAGINRFIFLSSVKVNGELTDKTPFDETSKTLPSDPYGISKLDAEAGLLALAAEYPMEIVIIRPPLVYGENVKANFQGLLKIAKSGLPLPFSSINNERSMVYVKNLVDFISICLIDQRAKNQVFLISDQDDLSLPKLVSIMRTEMGMQPRIFHFPLFLFKIIGVITGKKLTINRLIGSLKVNSSKASTLLNWRPPYSAEDGIKNTASFFLREVNK